MLCPNFVIITIQYPEKIFLSTTDLSKGYGYFHMELLKIVRAVPKRRCKKLYVAKAQFRRRASVVPNLIHELHECIFDPAGGIMLYGVCAINVF